MQVFKPELKSKYTYCPTTGNIIRAVRCGNYPQGSVCLSKVSNGKYLKVENMQAHRLAWFLHTGEQPPEQIDHINGNGLDNRWCNLRAADNSTNMMNIGVTAKSTTGIKGIFPVRGGKLYRAEVCIGGRRIQKHSKDVSYLQDWVTAKRKEVHGQYAHN